MIISSCELTDAKSNADCEINKENLKAELTEMFESLQQLLSKFVLIPVQYLYMAHIAPLQWLP